MDEIVRIENLIVEYQVTEEEPAVRAVDDITLSVEEGSFTAILGRNGSGKSTLAKTINALLLPKEGRVLVCGFDTSKEEHLWDVRQNAGMVFQNPDNQLVSAIVEDDVAFGPENLGVEPEMIRQRVNESLMAVDMYDYRKKAPHQLSGGQKQRIAIAGVIAMKPAVIIFDEPTAMLDPKGRKEVMTIMKKLHEEGITIILITHFMEEAVAADRIIILDDGKAVLDGSPYEAFEKREIIEAAGLEIPMAADIALRLIDKGIALDRGILDADELVEALCQLK